MADPDWIAYAGVVTGVIGAVTGVAGAIMGYISYRRTEDLKSLDLRLEIKKTETELALIVGSLAELLNNAKRSHQAVLAAIGHVNSGGAKKWLEDWEQDLQSANEMLSQLPDPDTDYTSFSQADLESGLVMIHRKISVASALKEKYEVELAADEKQRDRIRGSHRGRA